MPKIEQLDWSKLKPATPDKTSESFHKMKGYRKYEPDTKHKKRVKIKFIDKRIFTEQRQNLDHLRSIQAEL